MELQKIAYLAARPGKSAEMRVALQTLETLTRQEPWCVAFSFYQAVSNPDMFVLLEHFASEEAFNLHMQQAHTQAFFALDLVERVQVFPVAHGAATAHRSASVI